MSNFENSSSGFLKSLGFPELKVHPEYTHFDFIKSSRRILVIGPMGSGKTEFSSRVWRDSKVALKKSDHIKNQTTSGIADRREVFFIRSMLDAERFPEYPADALAFRGGYERCGDSICLIKDSFELEKVIEEHPKVGTWIIDEASFYDERIAYVIKNYSEKKQLSFIFPTLVLNFRKNIFNHTARLIMEISTDVIPLTAYCEHIDCLEDSYYTYRYYQIDGQECPALYFDPLIIIGGDIEKNDTSEPNYCTRCGDHHYLPGKEYTYLVLKPMGEKASKGSIEDIKSELELIKNNISKSKLYSYFENQYLKCENPEPINMNSLKVGFIPEKILIFLFAEQNLISEQQLRQIVGELHLDKKYMERILYDNKRPVDFDQITLGFE